MIHISGEWYLTADQGNLIISLRKTNKNNGEEYFEGVAYPRDFEQLMNSLSARKIRISAEKANDFKELIAIEKQIKEDNAAFYKRFEKEIKEILKEERKNAKSSASDNESSGGGTDENES